MFNKAILGLLLVGFSCQATQMATFSNSIKPNSVSTSTVKGKSDKDSNLYVISSLHVNRIVTPFKNPSIKLDNLSGVSYKSKGSVLYLSTIQDQNIAAFITETGDESNAISVLLSPKPVGPKEIVLDGATNDSGSPMAKQFERSSPRTTALKDILSMMVLGDLPPGYQPKTLSIEYIPECFQPGISFDFFNGQLFSGGDYVVAVGVAENTSSLSHTFFENNCYKEGVVAVSAYPAHELLPHEKTEVFVVFHRNKPTSVRKNDRKSLLGE